MGGLDWVTLADIGTRLDRQAEPTAAKGMTHWQGMQPEQWQTISGSHGFALAFTVSTKASVSLDSCVGAADSR